MKGKTARKLKSLLRQELVAPRRKPMDGDDVAENAKQLDNMLTAVRQDGNAVAYEADGEAITLRQEFDEEFAAFRGELGSSATLAALRGDAAFFDNIAKAIRRLKKRKRFEPDMDNVALLKSLCSGETSYQAAKSASGAHHDDFKFEAFKKRAQRFMRKASLRTKS